jgi:spore coat protein CotH
MRLMFKRHYKLLVLLALVLGLLTFGLGNQRIIAYTVPGNLSVVQASTNSTNDIALFDNSIVHSIQILIPEEEYQQMITTYQQTSSKDYFQADVIIDGVGMDDVGVRLKGNASLRTALGGMGELKMAGGREFNPENMPGFDQDGARPQFDPENMPDFDQREASPGGRARPEGQMPEAPAGDNFGRGGGGMGQNTQIPLLIKFDEFVSGQTYQGYSRLAIRSAGISYDASMLQEPVTNSVFQLAGLPAAQTAYAGFQLNDETEQLFVISEVIDETYLENHFNNPDGVLYKAELNATLTYQGEDPSAYANSFSQETRQKDADFTPLIAFLRFLSESDDATFASQLPDYLDVESFAAYLAINNLLVNTDSMAGMGNNYYFYYDDLSGLMTILMWDGNESLGKLGGDATYDLYFHGGSGMGGRMGRTSNQLITRFLANPTFKTLYEAKLEHVYQQAFLSGAIEQLIETYTDVVKQAHQERALVDQVTYEQAAADVLDFITRRSAYLASTPLLGE